MTPATVAPVRWVELPDCPVCPHPWPWYLPWLIGGGIVAIVLIIAISVTVVHVVNRRAEMTEYRIRNTHHCPVCGDDIEGTPA